MDEPHAHLGAYPPVRSGYAPFLPAPPPRPLRPRLNGHQGKAQAGVVGSVLEGAHGYTSRGISSPRSLNSGRFGSDLATGAAGLGVAGAPSAACCSSRVASKPARNVAISASRYCLSTSFWFGSTFPTNSSFSWA
ncbi:hypothetical protein [Meiothermus phage MMP17]|nr:hypothetical protein [Meiothermus phage MMP17]